MLVSAFLKNNFIINVVHVLLLMDNYVAVNSDTLHEFQFNFFVFAMKVHEKTKAHQWRVFVMDTNMTKLLQSDRRYYFFLHVKLCRAFVETIQKWKIKIALRKSNSPWYLTSTTRSLFTCYGISNFNLTK